MIEKEKFSLSAHTGFGKDVATDREDDLDRACLQSIIHLVSRRADATPTLVLDVGGANGSMSVKMANRSAVVTMIDPISHPLHIANCPLPNIRHVAKKIQDIDEQDILCLKGNKLDIIYAQKVFHYMPYVEALETLKRLRKKFGSEDCRLFISLSSLDCPLGTFGYAGRGHHLHERYAIPLNDEAAHLGISHPMTLYRREEVELLLKAAGFKNIEVTESEYGTFKASAQNELT